MTMEYYNDDFDWGFKAKQSISIIIVGAGIAGLAASIGTPIHRLVARPLLIAFKASSALGIM